MTRIFYREYYERTLIEIDGHSGFGEKGKDIVCAAVSALTCTLMNCVRDEESADRVRLIRDIVRDGYVCLEIEHFDFAKERTKAITETCISGLYMLAQEYPEYVRFE